MVLNVNQNLLLRQLDCSRNNLSHLFLSQTISLETLLAHENNLTELDLSNHQNLLALQINNNNLTELNLRNGNNYYLNPQTTSCNDVYNGFCISANPNLLCVEVDDVSWANTNWTFKDAQTSFTIDCSVAFGCTDQDACNYNAVASIDDSSCYFAIYDTTIVNECDSFV